MEQKLLRVTIAAQRKFLARQRSEAIRNRPPIKNQLRNQMMTYLKQCGDLQNILKLRVEIIERHTSNIPPNEKRSSRNLMLKSREEDKGGKGYKKEKAHDEDKEIDYEILDKKYPIIDWKTENHGTKPQFDESKRLEEINLMSNDEQDEFWNSQHEWKIVSWKLHSSSGVHTLMTEEGLVLHMLIEKKYPLKKEIVMQMLKLKLESEEESTMALELI
ncbi:hypothetical protein Tco_1315022 [Tanacetum coccineum]